MSRVLKFSVFFVILIAFCLNPMARSTPVSAANEPAWFMDEFDSSSLDPEWQVVEFTGTRVYGFTSPANHFSLVDHPGYLRYSVDPMTHERGFLNNYANLTNVYDYNPGLELHRLFSGAYWRFETKVDYNLPYTNGRALSAQIYFGDGGANTFAISFSRYRDVLGSCNCLNITLLEKFGPTFDDTTYHEYYALSEDIYASPESSYFYRLERNGGILTASWSGDGVTWTQAFSRDMGVHLDGLPQRLVISGLSWFDSAGSYADYDYVALKRLVDVDIKPKSEQNIIPCKVKSGLITVALLSSDAIDATTIDHRTVNFEGAYEAHRARKAGELKRHLADIDQDGDLDLILHFRLGDTRLTCNSTEATLFGETFDHIPFVGHDMVQMMR